MNSTSNSSLLLQAQAGDAESLGLLLKNYFRYLNTLSLGHLDERIRVRVSASDIVQETLLEAHRDFQFFVGKSLPEFTGWLRKILFNNLARAIEVHLLAAKRDVRRQQPLENVVSGDSSGIPKDLGLQDFAASVGSNLAMNETLLQLTRAINQLPGEFRQVIHWRHVEGLPFPEIAQKMDKSHGATRMLWVRAVEQLKRIMTPEDSQNR